MDVAASFLWVTKLSGVITLCVSSTRGLLPGGPHLKPRYCPHLRVSLPASYPPGSQGQNVFSFSKLEAKCACRYWAADLEMLSARGMMLVTLLAVFCLNFSIPVLNFCFPSCLCCKTPAPIWHLPAHRWAGPCWPLLNDAMKLLIIVATPSVLKTSEKVIFFMVSGGFGQTGCAFTAMPRAGRHRSVFQVEVMWARALWVLGTCCARWGLT